MCDMPELADWVARSPVMDVTCPFCWWRGKRKYYFEADPQKKPCPKCGARVSGGWLFKTCDPVRDVTKEIEGDDK